MGTKKAPGGVEDLALGMGIQRQLRNGREVQITELNGSNIPYSATLSLNEKIDSLQTTSGGGDMFKSVYDKNDNGVVDNSEQLGGHDYSYFGTQSEVTQNTAARHTHSNKTLLDTITDSGAGDQFLSDDGTYKTVSGGGGGDMTKAVYDTNDSGVVDDAEKLGGQEPSFYTPPADTDDLAEGSTNLYYTEARVSANSDVAANTADRHSHSNSAVLDALTDAGSGAVITAAERTRLGTTVISEQESSVGSLVSNALILTQTEYDGLTPQSDTIYFITA